MYLKQNLYNLRGDKVDNPQKPKKQEVITFRLEESEKEILQEFANEKEMTISQVIRKAIKYYIDYSD